VLLATVTAAAGAAGVYWYLTQPQSFQELEATAKKREDEISRKARELADTSKARAEDLLKQSEQQYSDIKVRFLPESRNNDLFPLLMVQASGQDKLAAARARADSAASGAQAKYDSYKYPTLPDSRAAVTKDQTQGGWFDWLRWGRSKADQGKRDGAQKVVDAADEVRKRADEHK
jgi:hypothetical protein